MKISKAIAPCISLSLSIALLITGLIVPCPAQNTQNRVIVVNADQPNVWTLEQAHYLLAQMHRRNLDLKAKSLEDLDPNEINGLRFEVMRMLIEFGATFNQADLSTNRMFSQNQEFSTQRRRDLTAEGDRLRKESITLAAEIDELETQKADAESDQDKARVDAKIASKTNRLAKVDKEIENINNELKTLNVSGGELKATTGAAEFDPAKLPKSVFDKAFETAAASQIEQFNEAPKLNASLRLDNFLQMQYEIIAKQLTLLRDELGPGERLLFLEMPQTINVAHHEADKKWAQSWWKIAGYTKRQSANTFDNSELPSVDENQKPITVQQDFKSIVEREPISLSTKGERTTDKKEQSKGCKAGVAKSFRTSAAIKIRDTSAAPAAHPLRIQVSGLVGRIENVSVQLLGLTHPNLDEIDMLLVGPENQTAVFFSDVGGPNPVDNLNITLANNAAAGNLLAATVPAGDGVYNPENFPLNPDQFPLGTPVPPSINASLSTFRYTKPNGEWKLYIVDDTGDAEGVLAQGLTLSIATDCDPDTTQEAAEYQSVFHELSDDVNVSDPELNSYLTKNHSTLSNRLVRTVDLIPRQSSLNVNDMKLKTTAGAFSFVLSTLFGFGAQAKVQRQREQFAQFVQQELYSAAFGKGSREFGWTFTPMPGMNRLQSGVRTTYAVVVVPNDASSLVLEANGCYFPRSAYQPLSFAETKDQDWNVQNRTSRNCGGQRTKAFVVPIPASRIDGSNDFWVKRIDYRPVKKGEPLVVLIAGENFSSQIGVLINGTPLRHSVGLAQPLVRDDSRAGRLTDQEFQNAAIQGHIERIDANKIVFTFKMPDDFTGTPTITLVAPGKAIDLNWLKNISINDKSAPATLADEPDNPCGDPPTPGCVNLAKKMFLGDPPPPDLRIDRVEAFRSSRRQMNVLITGAGFKPEHSLFINGSLQAGATRVSDTLMSATNIPAPFDDHIQVTLVAGEETLNAAAIINPLQLKIDKVTVVSYEEASKEKPGVLIVKIEGRGFTRGLRSSPAKIRLNVASATEAFLTIPNPNQTEVITLRDPITDISVSTVVGRKPPEK